jgi:hypothetical protein
LASQCSCRLKKKDVELDVSALECSAHSSRSTSDHHYVVLPFRHVAPICARGILAQALSSGRSTATRSTDTTYFDALRIRVRIDVERADCTVEPGGFATMAPQASELLEECACYR